MARGRAFRIGLWIGIPLLVLVALGAGAFYGMSFYFNPQPPAKSYPKPSSALDAQRQDADYFRKLIALDFAFSPAARAEANREIDALAASKDVLPRAQFRLAVMRVAALADNGHTSTGSEDDARSDELPMRVAPFSDGFYVTYAKAENAAMLGGRVTAIDGHPFNDVLTRMATLRGGTADFRRYNAAIFLARIDLLNALGISAPEQSIWTVTTPDGRTVTQTLKAYRVPADEPYEYPDRWFSTEPVKGMPKDWQAYNTGALLPIALRDFDTTFRRFRLGCTAVIQLKANTDHGNEKIADFLAATDKDLAAKHPCNIILDNRFNGGGDYTTTYDFAKALPGKTDGRLYILTGPETFSAGITTTAFIKDAGGDRVTILGEPVGDRLAFFSEGRRGCLPNFHLCMNYQRGKHDYAHPCNDPTVCYWLNWVYPVRVKTLAPDETITMDFDQWRAGHDPVFERAVQLAAAR
jgi:hypothetical protein